MKHSIKLSVYLASTLIISLSSNQVLGETSVPPAALSPTLEMSLKYPSNFSPVVHRYAAISFTEFAVKPSYSIRSDQKSDSEDPKKQRKKSDIRKFYLKLLAIIATQ